MNKKLLTLIFFLCITVLASAQDLNCVKYTHLRKPQERLNIRIPDILGYKVLKCDFHTHTVFSDGNVWPQVRVNEAWAHGLDALSITDHIEYLPHKEYIKGGDFNSSYLLAKPTADNLGIILIKGAEITRQQADLGHFNALFIQDANKLQVEDPEGAIDAALAQKAFILWNHPGWSTDSCYIRPFQEKLFKGKKIHGIEVFNGSEYYPYVVQWCADKNLPFFSNTDVHGLLESDWNLTDHFRNMTLVLVKEHSEAGIREALFAGRTLAYFANELAGKPEYLKALFLASVQWRKFRSDEKWDYYQFSNQSDIPYVIRSAGGQYTIGGGQSTVCKFTKGEKELKMEVRNMHTGTSSTLKI